MTEPTITKSNATKVTITITAELLWLNFVSNWAQDAWEEWESVEPVTRVARILMREKLIPSEIRFIFEEGFTAHLLGQEMMMSVDQLDTIAEVIVVKGDDRITVFNENIKY